MSKLKSLEELFAGKHFDREGMCVRWYLRYKLSLSDLVEMMAERGINSRTGPMLGFKNFNSAAITLAEVELLHRIRKGTVRAQSTLLLRGGTPSPPLPMKNLSIQ